MYRHYMDKILLPNSKAEDLVMKNFFSRHQKDVRQWESLAAPGRCSLYLPTTGRIGKL